MGIFNLSNAEREIMEFLWTLEETATLQDVIRYCNEEKHHTWKQQTIYTFLTRLEQKGAVTAQKRGQKRYYSASMSYDEFQKTAIDRMLSEDFDGSIVNLLSAFSCGSGMSAEDKAALKEFINE